MRRARIPRRLPMKTKLWLVVVVVLSLLAMAFGGWIAESTQNQKWVDDDSLLLKASPNLKGQSSAPRPSSDLYRNLLVIASPTLFSRCQQSRRIQNERQLRCDVNKRGKQRIQEPTRSLTQARCAPQWRAAEI